MENKLEGEMERNGGDDIVWGTATGKNPVKIKQALTDNLLSGQVGHPPKRLFVPVDRRNGGPGMAFEELRGCPASEAAASNNQVMTRGRGEPETW